MKGLRGFLTWQRAGVAIAFTPAIAWWLQRLIAAPSSGWFRPQGVFHLGGDLTTFHLAARLATHGQAELVYDPTALQGLLGADGGGSYFANPPPFLALVAPLGWISFEAAWWVVAALTVVGLGVGLWLLEVPRPVVVTGAALLLPPVYFTITFGQVTVLWFLILVGVYRLLRENKLIAAGLVAGLLVMKPTLVLGLVLWWLIEWRRYRLTAIAAGASAVGYLGLSYLLVPGVWPQFMSSVADLYLAPGHALRQWAQFSLWSTWRIVFPTQPSVATVVGVVSIGIVLVVLIPLLRRAESLDASYSVVILLTVLATPYVIVYDWVLLIISGVIVWRGAIADRDRLVAGAVVVTVASAMSTVIVLAMLQRIGFAIQLAPLVLLAVVWWFRDALASTWPRPDLL